MTSLNDRIDSPITDDQLITPGDDYDSHRWADDGGPCFDSEDLEGLPGGLL